jgi:hypothetical protein
MVEKKHGMGDCHWPQCRIGHVRPMDRCMKHHHPGDAHNRLDGVLGCAVVVVGTSSGKTDDLSILSKLCSESG